MKKIKRVFVLLLAVVLLAGCSMKEDFNLKIRSDKKVGFEVKLLMDNEMIDTMISMNDSTSEEGKTYTDEERWKYLDESDTCKSEEGYTCEKITEGDYKGFKMIMSPTDIDSMTGTGDKINLAEMNNFNGSLFTKTDDVYSSNFEFNLSGESNEYSSYISQMDAIKLSFVVTLPNPSISNNADKVSSDGLTLTWDLSPTANKSIDFSFSFDKNAKTVISPKKEENTNTDKKLIKPVEKEGLSLVTLVLIGACGLLVIVVIILVVILLARKPNKKKVEVAKEDPTKTE